tara:strand:- start:5908 stop:6828 length:921 start_codon:yes stop_codon:yes gene_type:complete
MARHTCVRDYILSKLIEYKNNEAEMKLLNWEFKVQAYENALKCVAVLPENTVKSDVNYKHRVAGKSITRKINVIIDEYNSKYLSRTVREPSMPVQVPVPAPVQVPVQVPVPAPVQVPVPAPVQVPVPEPVQVPVKKLSVTVISDFESNESMNIELSIRMLQALTSNDTDDFRQCIVNGLINVNSRDKVSGTSWIHWAAYANKPDMIELLVEMGADTDAKALNIGTIKFNHGMTPIQVAKHFKSHHAFIKLYQLSKNTDDIFKEYIEEVDGVDDPETEEQKSTMGYLKSVFRNLWVNYFNCCVCSKN